MPFFSFRDGVIKFKYRNIQLSSISPYFIQVSLIGLMGHEPARGESAIRYRKSLVFTKKIGAIRIHDIKSWIYPNFP